MCFDCDYIKTPYLFSEYKRCISTNETNNIFPMKNKFTIMSMVAIISGFLTIADPMLIKSLGIFGLIISGIFLIFSLSARR